MRRVRFGVLGVLLAAVVGFGGALPAVAAEPTARLSLFKAIENLDTGASLGDRTLWTMHAVNVATGETFTGDGLNGMQSRLVPPGTYRIFETGGVAGYAFFAWNCDGDMTTEPERTITITANQSMTCTVQNNAIQGRLTLVKNVQGGGAAPSEWTLRAQGPSTIEGVGGSAEVQNQPARIGVYTLSEFGGPGSYVPGPWTCERRDLTTGEVTEVPVTGDQFEMTLGGAVTCQITNTGDLPHLTLVKEVVDPAATGYPLAAPSDFVLSASGPERISGPSGSDAVDHASIDPGAYTLAESGPAGYSGGAWTCVDATSDGGIDGGLLFVRESSDITCRITNTFAGGWLTLVKNVVGSDQPPSDWTLTAAGPETVTGASGSAAVSRVPVPVGDYALAEADGPAGYAAGPWSCTGGALATDTVTVGAGADVTCTVTNTLEVGQLTLVKNVVNAGGGPLTAQDWELTARSADTVISGASGSGKVSFAAVAPGTFTLSEASTAPEAGSYTSEGWSCVDDEGTPVGTGDTVEVVPLESVICTVTNRWTESTLTLRKQVASAFGTPALPSAWTLTATDGAATVSGPANSPAVTQAAVAPGAWTLGETGGPSGYDPLGWNCSGGSVSGDVVQVPPSKDVVCILTNASITPSLTLVKQVVNGERGRAVPADFELKARGPGNAALSGPSGSEFVTDMRLPPGDYIFSEDGPSGYEGEWSCTGTAWDGTTATLGFGEDAICTATNTFVGGTLTLRKAIVGVGPGAPTGPADATDWTLRAIGGGQFPRPRIEGASGETAVTLAPLGAGAFRLSERAVAGAPTADYRSDGWACTGGALEGDVVEVTAGMDTVCTVTNVYDPGPEPEPEPEPENPDPGTDGGPGPATGSEGGAASDLAATGLAPTTVVMAGAGGLLVLLGAVLIATRRRRRRGTDQGTGVRTSARP